MDSEIEQGHLPKISTVERVGVNADIVVVVELLTF